MSFRLETVGGIPDAGTGGGEIDYRLARNAVIREYRRGRLSRLDICDAHPELLRAARSVGADTTEPCPVCESGPTVHVSYAFGPHLPSGGRCFADARELGRLVRRAGQVACYVVEVCAECSWNHLARTFMVNRRAARGAP